jgi:hypothetical protein
MYCLAERHLSPVQKAIQSAHAIVEFIGHTTPMDEHAKVLAQWMDEDKTIIILDGGNSDEMMTCLATLKDNHIPFAEFHEPDMGGFLTAICFLVDERAWNYDVYGRSYEEYNCRCYLESGVEHLDYNGWIDKIGGARGKIIKEMISTRRLAV